MRGLGYYWIRLTFVVVGVALVVASLLISHAAGTRTLRRQLTASNGVVLREIANHISERVRRLDRRLIELAGRRATLDLMHARFEDAALQRETARQVQIELLLIRRSDELVHSAGLHVRRSGYLLSDEIGLTYLVSDDSRQVDVPLARLEIEAIIRGGDSFRMLSTVNPQGFVRVIPMRRYYPLAAASDTALGTLFLGLDVRRLSELVLNVTRGQIQEIVLFDSDSDEAAVLAASSTWAVTALESYRQPGAGESQTPFTVETRLQGERYGIARTVIPETGWIMVGAVPLSGGTPILRPMQLSFLLIGAGMFIAALISLMAVSHLTIDPLVGFIRRLSASVPEALPRTRVAVRLPASNSHLSFLEGTFRDAISRSQRLADRYASANPIVQRYCLRNLFTGTDLAGQLISQLAEHDMPLRSGAFLVLRLAFMDSSKSRSTEDGPAHTIPGNARTTIDESRLAEISSQYVGPEGQCAVLIEKGNRLGILVSGDSPDTVSGASMLSIAEQIRIGLAQTLSLDVSAGLGTVVTDPQRISDSWRAATKALDYALMFQTRSLYRYDDIALAESSNAMRDLFTDITALQESVRLGNTQDAQHKISTLFRDAHSSHLSSEFVRQIGVHAIMEGLRVAQESGCLIPEGHAQEAAAAWNDLEHAETIREVEDCTLRVIAQLTADVGRQRQEHHRHELIDSIMEYLEDQYANPELSLSYVAQRFSISPAYLSKLFKEHAGVKYIEFLSRLRVTVAKTLLERGSLNINEVASAVGYTNPKSFIRMFRSETGSTPGEYRRLHAIRNGASDSPD